VPLDDIPEPVGPPTSASLRETLAAGGVRLDRSPGVVTVVLNRPDVRNAQTPATWAALAAVGDWLPADVRVVVLRAEGPSFSAGLHVSAFQPTPAGAEPSLLHRLAAAEPDQRVQVIAGIQRSFTWWRESSAVTIAAVQGHAVGAGFQLALACDLRLASTQARFAMRETSLGLVPDLAGTKPLVELVGYARALEICATGRWVDAPEAATLGLVNDVVDPERLDATVEDLVIRLLRVPASALRETKALLAGAGERTHGEQQAAERAAQSRLVGAFASG